MSPPPISPTASALPISPARRWPPTRTLQDVEGEQRLSGAGVERLADIAVVRWDYRESTGADILLVVEQREHKQDEQRELDQKHRQRRGDRAGEGGQLPTDERNGIRDDQFVGEPRNIQRDRFGQPADERTHLRKPDDQKVDQRAEQRNDAADGGGGHRERRREPREAIPAQPAA